MCNNSVGGELCNNSVGGDLCNNSVGGGLCFCWYFCCLSTPSLHHGRVSPSTLLGTIIRSAQVASKDVALTGSVNKSGGDRVVCLYVQLTKCCVFLFYRGDIIVKCVCSHRLSVRVI